MAPPEGVTGGGGARLYISRMEGADGKPEQRAEMLARKLDQRLNHRLQQIREQMDTPQTSPNSEQTGRRLDLLA